LQRELRDDDPFIPRRKIRVVFPGLKMAWRSTLMILLAAAVSSRAANLHHMQFESREDAADFEEKQYDMDYVPAEYGGGPPSHGLSLMGKIRAVEDALETIADEEFRGFRDNYEVFMMHLGENLGAFQKKYSAAIVPLIEACPAEVFKKVALDAMKAILSLMEDVEKTIEKYNPLHPQVDKFSMVRRKLTNISTLGGSIGKLFEAVDDLVVAAAEALVEGMKMSAAQLKHMTAELENVPGEFLKTMAVEALNRGR